MSDMTDRNPRSILLHERIHYAWLHDRMIPDLRERLGATFTIVSPRNAVSEKRKRDLAGADRVIEHDLVLAAAEGPAPFPESVFETARGFEIKYGVSYLRDIVQQDRWVSTYFVGDAHQSFFGQLKPPPMVELMHEINTIFEYFETVFEEQAIDLVIGWPSHTLINAVTHHIALARGIPGTFLTAIRRKHLLMWSDGPYVGPRYIAHLVSRHDDVDLSILDDIEPPRDTREAIQDLDRERAFSTLTKEGYRLTRDFALFKLREWVRKEPYNRTYKSLVSPLYYRWRAHRYLDARTAKSFAEATALPYVLFLLPYEPEYPSGSLAREFNDTRAVVRQLALSIPAGMRLVVKEHVVGIGNRPIEFYETIARHPNVILADNSLMGQHLAAQAEAVATINGTVGLEAACFGKSAVLFSGNVEYAYLPHVRVVERFKDLPAIMREAVRPKSEAEVEAIRKALAKHLTVASQVSVNTEELSVFFGDKDYLSEAEYALVYDSLVDVWRFLITHGVDHGAPKPAAADLREERRA